MSWTLLAFGSVFFFTSLYLLQRILAVESKNSRAMALIFNVIAGFIAFLFFIFSGGFKSFSLPHAPRAWIALLIASFCYAIYERGRFVAAKLLDASILTTIINIGVLVAFVCSLFLYAETLTLNKSIGGLFIVGALFLVSFKKNAKKTSKKGLLVAVIISVALGLGWSLDKLGAYYFNANTYNILIWLIPIIFIYPPALKFEVLKTEFKISSWKIFVLAGLNVSGYFMQLKALEMTEATKVIPITQTAILFTVLLGIILLKEREYIPRKIIAGLMAIVGAYFLI